MLIGAAALVVLLAGVVMVRSLVVGGGAGMLRGAGLISSAVPAEQSSDLAGAVPVVVRAGLRLEGHTKDVTGVSFNRDGTLLATSSVDNTVRLWNVAAGQTIRVLQAGQGWFLNSVALNLDGSRVAASSFGPGAGAGSCCGCRVEPSGL